MRGRDEDVAQPVAVGTDLCADPLLVDVEQALLVDDLDGHGLAPVGHDHRARRDRIGDVVVEARRVCAAAEQIAVPAAVVVAVDERIAGVVVAVVLSVDVRLLERERPRRRRIATGARSRRGRRPRSAAEAPAA